MLLTKSSVHYFLTTRIAAGMHGFSRHDVHLQLGRKENPAGCVYPQVSWTFFDTISILRLIGKSVRDIGHIIYQTTILPALPRHGSFSCRRRFVQFCNDHKCHKLHQSGYLHRPDKRFQAKSVHPQRVLTRQV